MMVSCSVISWLSRLVLVSWVLSLCRLLCWFRVSVVRCCSWLVEKFVVLMWLMM